MIIWLAKTIAWILEQFHRGGSLPGAIALRLQPTIFDKLSVTCPILVVTGTNGKTTISNLCASLYQRAGLETVNNAKGDNLKAGILTTLLRHSNAKGIITAQRIVLEVDELNVAYIMEHLPVAVVIVSNFFRDQLDRAMEMEQTIQKIEKSLIAFQGTLILNGNDPTVLRLQAHAPHAKIVTYGLGKLASSTTSTTEANEGKFCPHCHHPLQYAYYHYAHLGQFTCSYCGFATPNFDVTLESIQEDSITLDKRAYPLSNTNVYMLYNVLCVYAIAKIEQFHPMILKRTLQYYQAPHGRNEVFLYQNHRYNLHLIKNPTGANEVLKQIEADVKTSLVLIVLNDDYQDGQDVSWIYDTKWERIIQANEIICSGSRAYDMALRLKYGGYQGLLSIKQDTEEALSYGYSKAIDMVILSTYTALAPLRKKMRRDENEA